MNNKKIIIFFATLIVFFIVLGIVIINRPPLPPPPPDCEILEQEINTMFEEMDYCDTDEDCARYEKFPFTHRFYNKNTDLSEIKNKVDLFFENKCIEDAEDSGLEEDLYCVSGKCVDLKGLIEKVVTVAEGVKKQTGDEESRQKQLQGCDWYKDKCPNGLEKSFNPIYGDDPKVEEEKFGLVFINKSFFDETIPSLKEIISLNGCKIYYPKTEVAVDLGAIYCAWEYIPGLDFCISDMDLCNPFSEEENAFIFKCMANTETYYWCCSK